MNDTKKWAINKLAKRHILLLLIILIASIIRIASIFVPHDLWWDSSVYIGMGKYIFSSGEAGLWEPNRPLVWPIILGFFWKIGLDPVFFGNIMASLFSLGSIILVYFIALKVFDKKTAVLSALFFSLSPTILRFNNILFSEIPSAFFLLLGIFFFLKKSYLSAGMFLGISLMTRFFQFFLIAPLLAYSLLLFHKEKMSFKELAVFLAGFAAAIIPFLIVNSYLYKNPFYPFMLQTYMTRYGGWIFYQPISFYFINLAKENFLTIFALLGIVGVFKERNSDRILVLALFLFPFLLYSLERHKEMRFLITILPFLYMATSAGLAYFISYLKRCEGYKVAAFLLIAFGLVPLANSKFDRYDDKLDPFYDYIKETNVRDGIWISNPSFIAFSGKKADELIYLPVYNSDKAKQLQKDAHKAKLVLLNTCDILPCHPTDNGCLSETERLLKAFNESLQLAYSGENEGCSYYIFED